MTKPKLVPLSKRMFLIEGKLRPNHHPDPCYCEECWGKPRVFTRLPPFVPHLPAEAEPEADEGD